MLVPKKMTFYIVFTNRVCDESSHLRHEIWFGKSPPNARNRFVDPAVLRFTDLVPVSLPRDLEPGVESLHLM